MLNPRDKSLQVIEGLVAGMDFKRETAHHFSHSKSVCAMRWPSTFSNSLRWCMAFCSILCLGLTCCNKAHSVTLTWQAPPPGPGVAIVGYNLYRSTTSGGPFIKLASNLTVPRYEDGLVASGRTYFYVVTAIDQAGRESRHSNEARAVIP